MEGDMNCDRDCGYDEFGFRRVTDFTGDAIGIDPAGCGCTDCLVGNSVPVDSPKMAALARAVAAGRKLVNRSGQHLALIERYTGDLEFVELPRAHSILGFYLDE